MCMLCHLASYMVALHLHLLDTVLVVMPCKAAYDTFEHCPKTYSLELLYAW